MVMAWVLLRDEHISMDVVSSRFPPKVKIVLDLVFYLLIFFPLLYFLFEHSLARTWTSVLHLETSNLSYWRPYVWPFRIVVSLSLLLLILQGIANFIRQLYTILDKKL